MVEVKIGTKLPDIKKGESQKGTWALSRIKADKGYAQIDVWAANADDVGNEPMEIGEIKAVVRSARQMKDKDGNPVLDDNGKPKWVEVVSVQATFVPSGMSGFAQLTDDEIPFK